MNILRHLLKSAMALNRTGLNYALIGGISCILMGVRRATGDIDYVVEVNSVSDMEKLLKELKREGYEVKAIDPNEVLKGLGRFSIELEDGYRLDFKIAKEKIHYETLKTAVTVKIRGVDIRLTRIEENIAAKLLMPNSLKDIEDALWLMYQYHEELNWNRVDELIGMKSIDMVMKLLDRIAKELSEDRIVLERVKYLRNILLEIKRNRII
ncbi:MAG: hypothetical protein DRJ49_02720 [Thermoprotei archaeon]|nr:MAG: hypothetical protein DRJ49_02720 [Thermoprotei archaeon]